MRDKTLPKSGRIVKEKVPPLAVLDGISRYAGINTLRQDAVCPELLGFGRIVSEDSVRNALKQVSKRPEEWDAWIRSLMDRLALPLLSEPYVADMDNTVKPLYGHQEGAEKSYNPKKPGRPSQNHQTWAMGTTRLILGVDVLPGKRHAGKYGAAPTFDWFRRLPPHLRPRLRERLAAGDVDLVIYPFDESFPVDTFGDVRAFVEKGGVLAVLGGMPLWFPMRETAPGAFQGPSGITGGASAPNRRALKIDVSAWWIDNALPRNALDNRDRAFPTEAAKAAGFKDDPAGEPGALRFQTPKLLEGGDEFIPLLTVKDANGRDAAAASVTRFAGGGSVIVSGLMGRGISGSAGEAGQARYLPRAMAIAFAEGVDQFYWYNFRSREDDPQYSEHHFGLVHSNRTPKPALGAYSNFILARPPGSVQTPGPWHDEARKFFFPQWTRPDGTKAGILWTTGPAAKRELRFDADGIVFRSYIGLKLAPVRIAPGTYRVPVSGDPIFFEGGALAE